MQLNYNKQKGSILVFSVILISVIIIINFSIAAIFIPKLKVIRQASNSVAAFYAADSAIEWCINEIRVVGDATPPVLSNGAMYTINQTSPPFGVADICPYQSVVNHRAVGLFGDVSRSIEISDAGGP